MGLVEEITACLLHFQEEFTVETYDSFPSSLLTDLYRSNALVAFYTESLRASTSGSYPTRITVYATYRNRDVPLRDVHVVSGKEELNATLCQYLGNYKNRLVVFVPRHFDAEEAFRCFMEECGPYYPNLTRYQYQTSKGAGRDTVMYDFSFAYRIGRVKLEMMENEVDAEVERVSRRLFMPNMPEVVKAYLVHNYLASTIRYTDEAATPLEMSYQQSAYGALILKKCVCQGYAEAFKRFMDEAGIGCDLVCGQIIGSTEYHAWNILHLHGGRECYHVDVTWDSLGDGSVKHTYFGVPDSTFAGKRTWNTEFHAHCDATENLQEIAQAYVLRRQLSLLQRGIDERILGC